MDGKALLKRFDKAKKRRNGSLWSHLQECYAYAAPQRETFYDYQEGQKKNTELSDDTAIIAVQTFANRVQKALIPAWQDWTKLVAGSNTDPDEQVEFEGQEITLKEALEKVNERVFEYVHRSNFTSRAYEAIIDLAISTGTLTCEFDVKKDKLIFNSIPLPQLYLEAGAHGTISGHWRQYELEGELIERMWTKAKLPTRVKENIDKDPTAKVKLVEGCIVDGDTNMYYVILETDGVVIFEQDEGDTSPFYSFRGMVVAGEIYGRGQVMQVLPSIKTLNQIKEDELITSGFASSGAWTGVSDSIFNPYTVQISPGVIIPVMSNSDKNPTLRSLPMDFNVQYTHLVAADLISNINKALFAEPLGSTEDPTKTATEVQIRAQMDLERAGSFFSRLTIELVEQTMLRVHHVLRREGKIPKLLLDGKEIKLKHSSPITLMGNREDVQALGASMQAIMMFGEAAALDAFKPEEVAPYINNKLGIPSTLTNNKEEIQQLQKQRAEQQQAMMMAQQAQEMAKNAPKQ
jgi:hypothetical protein